MVWFPQSLILLVLYGGNCTGLPSAGAAEESSSSCHAQDKIVEVANALNPIILDDAASLQCLVDLDLHNNDGNVSLSGDFVGFDWRAISEVRHEVLLEVSDGIEGHRFDHFDVVWILDNASTQSQSTELLAGLDDLFRRDQAGLSLLIVEVVEIQQRYHPSELLEQCFFAYFEDVGSLLLIIVLPCFLLGNR